MIQFKYKQIQNISSSFIRVCDRCSYDLSLLSETVLMVVCTCGLLWLYGHAYGYDRTNPIIIDLFRSHNKQIYLDLLQRVKSTR